MPSPSCLKLVFFFPHSHPLLPRMAVLVSWGGRVPCQWCGGDTIIQIIEQGLWDLCLDCLGCCATAGGCGFHFLFSDKK